MTDNNGSGMNAILGIVAVVAIIIIAYFAIDMLRNQEPSDQPGININLPGGSTSSR